MDGKIYVDAEDVWNYHKEHEAELEDAAMLIAERVEYGTEILLSDDEGFPLITALVDDEEVYSETGLNADDCEDIVEEMYMRYLSKDFLNTTMSDGIDIAEESEGYIDDAIIALLDVIAPHLAEDVADVDEVIEDVKDHICEYLYTKHKVSIYRPMFLECEDGTEEFYEYPYPEMELDG